MPLISIEIEDFRCFFQAKFDLDLESTLIYGANGSGKSSFAEALELLLTGDTFRWSGKKSKVWKDGWRNLHHPTAALHAELILEGEKAPATITRKWANEAPLEAVETSVQVQGKPKTDLASLGWTQALVTHRPFLSYNELGSMLEEGPSKLYDALASILGLDDLVRRKSAWPTRASRERRRTKTRWTCASASSRRSRRWRTRGPAPS